MCIVGHNWSVMKHLHRLQSVVETSRHKSDTRVDDVGQLGSQHHGDTYQWLSDSISSYRDHIDCVQSKTV